MQDSEIQGLLGDTLHQFSGSFIWRALHSEPYLLNPVATSSLPAVANREARLRNLEQHSGGNPGVGVGVLQDPKQVLYEPEHATNDLSTSLYVSMYANKYTCMYAFIPFTCYMYVGM